MNFNEALFEMQRLEDENLEIPEDTKQFLKDKIDSYFHYLNHLEGETERLKALAMHYVEKSNAKANKAARLKKWILDSMEAYGWDSLKGDKHSLKIVTQKRFCQVAKANEDLMAKYPDLVVCELQKKFSFDPDALKKAFEANPDEIKELADYKEIKYLRFG